MKINQNCKLYQLDTTKTEKSEGPVQQMQIASKRRKWKQEKIEKTKKISRIWGNTFSKPDIA